MSTPAIADYRYRNLQPGEQILPTADAREILNGANWGVLGITVHEVKVTSGGKSYSVKVGKKVLPISFLEKYRAFYSLPPD
ncbi:MAG: hypothetical protein WC835_03715 [Candidatus Paceibacterota bacterium]|jgi:hypothetical protein